MYFKKCVHCSFYKIKILYFDQNLKIALGISSKSKIKSIQRTTLNVLWSKK